LFLKIGNINLLIIHQLTFKDYNNHIYSFYFLIYSYSFLFSKLQEKQNNFIIIHKMQKMNEESIRHSFYKVIKSAYF